MGQTFDTHRKLPANFHDFRKSRWVQSKLQFRQFPQSSQVTQQNDPSEPKDEGGKVQYNMNIETESRRYEKMNIIYHKNMYLNLFSSVVFLLSLAFCPRTFIYDTCGKKFRRKSTMRRHLIRKHLNESEKRGSTEK